MTTTQAIQISGTDSTDTSYNLSVHDNGVAILTLVDNGKAITLVLSGDKLNEFRAVLNGEGK